MDAGYWMGCALGVATFFISGWLASKERKEGDADWKWNVLLALLGLAGTAVSAVQGVADARKGAKQAKIINAAQADINALAKRAEKADSEALALKQRFAPRVELLTPEVRQKLIDRLKAVRWANVMLVTIHNTDEAKDFGGAIAALIKDAELIVRREVVGQLSQVPIGIQGLQVQHLGGDTENVARGIADVFESAGIPDVRLFKVDGLGLPDAHVRIVVGVRE